MSKNVKIKTELDSQEEDLFSKNTNKSEHNLSMKSEHKTCAKCKKVSTKLYQQNLCKQCLTLSFKKLVKVIDSVRKV